MVISTQLVVIIKNIHIHMSTYYKYAFFMVLGNVSFMTKLFNQCKKLCTDKGLTYRKATVKLKNHMSSLLIAK